MALYHCPVSLCLAWTILSPFNVILQFCATQSWERAAGNMWAKENRGKEGRELCWGWVFPVPLPTAVDLPGDLLGSWWDVREILGMVCRKQISSSSRRLNSMAVVGRRVVPCWCQYHDRAKRGFLSFSFTSVKGTPKETISLHPSLLGHWHWYDPRPMTPLLQIFFCLHC